MNKSKKDYEKKIKRKVVKFYIHERKLYEFANFVNFQLLCKEALKNEYRFWLANGKTNYGKRKVNENDNIQMDD